jgi:hypothetical protein
MRFRALLASIVVGLMVWSAMFAYQQHQPRRQPRSFDEEDDPAPIPPDADEKTEFSFARIRYKDAPVMGWRRGNWTIDYPKADRQFLQGVRRLTRIHTRSMEEVVDFEGDEIFDWPWLYAVEVGHWFLDDDDAKKLRNHLMRGGFLMVDDFHGTKEWQVFTASMSKVFPDRPIVDIPDNDPAFHVLYDLDERFQVPGIQYFYTGRIYEYDGVDPEWKGIYDDKGRLMVAICHNMDLGDAWEHADHPRYPEKYSSLAYRVGINYIIYAMTH